MSTKRKGDDDRNGQASKRANTQSGGTGSSWSTIFREIERAMYVAPVEDRLVPCIEGCIGVDESDKCRKYFRKADEKKYYCHTYDGPGFAKEYPTLPLDTEQKKACCNCVSLCLYAREPGEQKFAEYLVRYLRCIQESVKNVATFTGFVVRLHIDMNVLKYMDNPPRPAADEKNPVPHFDQIIKKCKDLFTQILAAECCELLVVGCAKINYFWLSPDRTRCLRLLPLLDPRINVLAHRDADGVVTETDCHLLNAMAASKDRKRLFALADLPSAGENPAQPPSVRRVSGPYGFWLLWSEMANLIEENRHGVFYDDFYNMVAKMIQLNQCVSAQEEIKTDDGMLFLEGEGDRHARETGESIHTFCVDITNRAKIYTVDVLAGMLTMRARFSEGYLLKCITDMRRRNAAIFLRLGGQPDNINPDPFLTALLGCYERKEGARYCNVNDKIYRQKMRDGELVQYACCEMEMAFSADEMLLQEIFTPFILVPRTAPDPEKDGPFIHVQACTGAPIPQDLSVRVAENPALILPPRVCVAPGDITMMNGFFAFPDIGKILPFASPPFESPPSAPEKYRGCRKCGRRSRNRSR